MAQGKVVLFDSKKGWGFLRPNDGLKDVFVHQTAILMDGYRELRRGQVVEYELADGPKGIQAQNVKVVG